MAIRICIIGAGAIGSYLACRLANVGVPRPHLFSEVLIGSEPIITRVHVHDEHARRPAGGDADIGLRMLGPPSAYLLRVVRSVFEP